MKNYLVLHLTKNKVRTFIVLSLLLLQLFGSAQEKINQLDENGRRHGKWKIYLHKETWKTTDDSTKTEYYRFTYYDHGLNLYPMGPCGKKSYKLIIPEGEASEKQGTKLLDGEYTWLNNKGKLNSIQVFDKGEYVAAKEYKGESLEQYFDYTRKAESHQHGWTLTQYKKDGGVKNTYIYKTIQGKWMLIQF